MSILDDVERIRAADPDNMYNQIFDFPEQMAEALKIGKLWRIEASDFQGIKNIVAIGMGGSAIGADLVRSYIQDKLLIPFDICRQYTLPEYVDDETLVIASSYSGNTEETLAAITDAIERKAMLVAFSTGGSLAKIVEENEIPMPKIPIGLQPRSALSYSLTLLLIFMEKIGLVRNATKELETVVAALNKYREKYIEDNSTASNPAKLMAEKIKNKIVVIYSGPTLTDVVALRWKSQICENAKSLAFANQFPEFNHNELVGWSPHTEIHRSHMIVLILRDQSDHPQIRKRMNIVKDLIEARGVDAMDVHSRGESPLERMLSLIQLGDFVSYYLAVLHNVNPTPVNVIEALKAALAKE